VAAPPEAGFPLSQPSKAFYEHSDKICEQQRRQRVTQLQIPYMINFMLNPSISHDKGIGIAPYERA
jgi:hypothetical protein